MRACGFVFSKGEIGRRCFFDGKVTGLEAAAVDDGAVGNGVFTGGKRWKSSEITMFFTDCQRRRAAVGTSYAKPT